MLRVMCVYRTCKFVLGWNEDKGVIDAYNNAWIYFTFAIWAFFGTENLLFIVIYMSISMLIQFIYCVLLQVSNTLGLKTKHTVCLVFSPWEKQCAWYQWLQYFKWATPGYNTHSIGKIKLDCGGVILLLLQYIQIIACH